MPRSSSCSMEMGDGVDIFLRVLSNAMEMSANGLRVLVTAGAAGNGPGIARAFFTHGGRVQGGGIDEKAPSSPPKKIFHCKADVSAVAPGGGLFEGGGKK